MRLNNTWGKELLKSFIALETGKREKGGGRDSGEIPSLGGEHISNGGQICFQERPKYISRKLYDSLNQGKIQNRDVLLVKDGATTGKTAWAVHIPLPLAVNEHVFLIRSIDSSKLDNGYLFYFLRSDIGQRQIQKRYHGLIGGVNRSDVHDIEIILPPVNEQRLIATILTTVQQAIQQQERLIALTNELKKALMQKLFTMGTRGEPQKMTEIGPIPESWEIHIIDNNFEMQLGKMLSKKAKLGILSKPYLRNKNVQWGKIDVSDIYEMDFNKDEQLKFRLKDGDLLVCEGGEPGRAAIWYGQIEECYYQKALHRLRPKTNKITNQFLLYWLWYSIGNQNIQGISGASSTIAHLPATQLKRLCTPIPSIEEQGVICELLNNVEDTENLNIIKRNRLTDLFHSLLHQLMTAQIRVNEVDLSELKAIGIEVD